VTKEEGERLVTEHGEAQQKADEAWAAASDASPEVTAEAQRLSDEANASWDRMYAAWQELSAG